MSDAGSSDEGSPNERMIRGDKAEAARGDLRRRACVSVDVCVRESAWERESSMRGRTSWMPFVSRSAHRARKRKRVCVRVCVCFVQRQRALSAV